MKNTTLLFIAFVCISSFGQAQTIAIGAQVWTTKNLDVSAFRNGDVITQAKTDVEWKIAGQNHQPAWCYFNNNEENRKTYGKLYNWYAVNDARGLVPEGCHIPTNQEWTDLINSQGGESNSVSKFKSMTGWNNANGTNETGLSILPGGIRNDNGVFGFINEYGTYWSSTSSNSSTAFYRYFDYPKGRITQYAHDKSHGFSVRYIVDNLEESLIIPDNFHSIQILQNSESISENKNTGEILHNGSLYDGYLYNLYPSGQLKERFQIKKGVIIGDYSLYYEDFNFSIERFRDTNRIEELNASIIHEGDKLKQLSIDSSNSSNDQQEFFKKNIGSAKNHEALKTKNQENKLKGKKKEVFDNYSNLVSKYLNYLNEINNSQKIIAQFTKNRDLESEKIVYIPRPKMAFEKENDRKNGKYKSYYFNGRMKESGQYVNNIKEGEWSTYYENGKLESKGVFNKADMKIGDWQYFGLNGLISSKEKFENDGNIYSKINYSYFENGNLRDEIQVKISGVKGVKEGQYVEYHSNGKKKAEGKYNNNLQNGLWSYYFDNGLLQAKGNYINGNGGDQSDSGIPKNNRDGLWKIYTSDGKLLQDQSWTGIQQSLKSYYPSGNLQVKREYSNYPKNNYVETKYFDENGNVESESTYLNGKLNGISREYYSNGKIMAEGNSVNGKSHGKLKSYFDNGQLQMSFTADSTSLAAGNALGEIFQYDKSGKLINHVYANKDGSLLNKLAAASGSNSNSGTGVLSQARFNKSFNCECCGRTITGIKYAWGKDCGKASDDLLDPALYNYFSKSALTFESWYLYCGVNCVKTCSDTSPATGSPCN